MKADKRIQVLVTDKQYRLLKIESQARIISMSAVIREMINDRLFVKKAGLDKS